MLSKSLVVSALAFWFCAASAGCRRSAGAGAPDAWLLHKNIGPFIVRNSTPGTIAVDFLVENPSASEEMHLVLVRRSCQCLDFRLALAHVPPRSNTSITVFINTSPTTAESRLELRFATGLVEKPFLDLSLTLQTRGELEVRPYDLLLASIAAGEEKQVPFEVVVHKLRNEDSANDELEITCDDRNCRIDRDNEKRSVEGDISVRSHACRLFIPSAVVGETVSGGKVLLHVRHGDNQITKEVRYKRLWPITVSPTEVFVLMDRASGTTKTFVLRAAEPFAVLGASSDSKLLELANLPTRRSTEHVLTVHCNPLPASVNSSKATLALETDHPTQSAIKLIVRVLCKRESGTAP